jgi:hypothetical protein
VRVWLYDSTRDLPPALSGPGDVEGRRVVVLAATRSEGPADAWMALDDYDGDEAALLFAAPPGEQFRAYVEALLDAAVKEGQRLGFKSLLAHWRAGWSPAARSLEGRGFEESGPGWRLRLGD